MSAVPGKKRNDTQEETTDVVPKCLKEWPGLNCYLSKYQTLGNSYLIFDPNKNGFEKMRFDPAQDWIKRICDQNYGIGSNGLIVGPDHCTPGSFEFRIFNSDGSQAQLSGNGARIFAQYLLDAMYVGCDQISEFEIVAVSRELDRVVVEVRAEEASSSITTTIMTAPYFGPFAVGASNGVSFGDCNSNTVAALVDIGQRTSRGSWSDSTLLSIGNPHCVTFLEAYDLLPSIDFLKQMSSDLSFIADAPQTGSQNAVFCDGCNLQWCFVEDRHHIHLRIVERGEGPTLASGSSAAAALIAAFMRGLVDYRATVIMPGGCLMLALSIRDGEIANVQISGEATLIARIKVSMR